MLGDKVKLATKSRQGADQRLEFIEHRLFWDGRLNRSDLIAHFGISVPQSSNDLSRYQTLAPGNMEYDSTEKAYLPTPNFAPQFLRINAERYLAQLKALDDKVIGLEDTFMSSVPDVGVVPVPGRTINPVILRKMIATIRKGKSLNILYQSMSKERPAPMWRWITPHAFAFDGMRWHVRAFCHLRRAFIDFLLSRCLEVGDENAPGATADDDYDWNTTFDVILAPNPALSPEQQDMIATDYGMVDHYTTLPVRRALIYYFNKRLRFDVAEKLDKPKEIPVVIKNREEYERVLAEVDGAKSQQPERT